MSSIYLYVYGTTPGVSNSILSITVPTLPGENCTLYLLYKEEMDLL
jgi:hypothetical protein